MGDRGDNGCRWRPRRRHNQHAVVAFSFSFHHVVIFRTCPFCLQPPPFLGVYTKSAPNTTRIFCLMSMASLHTSTNFFKLNVLTSVNLEAPFKAFFQGFLGLCFISFPNFGPRCHGLLKVLASNAPPQPSEQCRILFSLFLLHLKHTSHILLPPQLRPVQVRAPFYPSNLTPVPL